MPQSGNQDLEMGKNPVDSGGDEHAPPPNQPPQGESFGDSSWPLFSIYSKYAEEEDNKMADRWQKDADGILIFTGLFSAAVAALLAVSVQDLRPNSQDTSAFYLANIYQILADPNLPRVSFPFPLPKPPPFSPPRYAVWVNSLWFLSLVISLTCALLATSLHQWARRYIRVTQPARCSPEKRARIRAFFADGVENMHLPWAVKTLPSLIHLSLFLFFFGLVVFLLNINLSVFLSVVWCIGLFSAVYVCITFMPVFRKDSPYYTPLSTPVSLVPVFILKLVKVVPFPCAWISVAFFATVYYCITCIWIIISSCTRLGNRHRLNDSVSMRTRLVRHGRKTRRWFILHSYRMKRLFHSTYFNLLHWADRRWNRPNTAEEIALKPPAEIDLAILAWTASAIGDDDALEKLYDVIPGFLNSKLVKLPKMDIRRRRRLYLKLEHVLNQFLHRTLSSNSVVVSVKIRRLDIYLNLSNVIFGPSQVSIALWFMLRGEFGQLPQTIETANALTRWCTSDHEHVALHAQWLVVSILHATQKRDDNWIAIARDQLGLPDHVFRDNISHGDDSVLLANLIYMIRQIINAEPWTWRVLSSLSKFNIHNTHPGLQNEFCALWNQIVIVARNKGYFSHPVEVLREIRHLYIALHQGTAAHPMAFSASTHSLDSVLYKSSSYPLCSIATHHQNATTVRRRTQLGALDDTSTRASRLEGGPIPGSSRVPQQAEESQIISTDVAHLSRQPSLSSTDIIKNIVHFDESTPDIPIDETGETSQTPTMTHITFALPGLAPATALPSPVPRPHSVSVQELDTDKRPDITAPSAGSDISSNADQIPQASPPIGSVLQTIEELSGIPPTTVTVSLSSPIMTPALHRGVTPMELPPSGESALIQPGRPSHPLISPPSSLITTSSHIALQVTSVLDTEAITSGSALNAHDGILDLARSIPMALFRHENQSAPSTPDIAENTLPPMDHEHN